MMWFFDAVIEGAKCFIGMVGVISLFLLGIITLPVWILPYMIYNKYKKD